MRNETTNTDNLTEDLAYKHYCPFCGRFVPKFHMNLPDLNIDRYVQPRCECEINYRMNSVVSSGNSGSVAKDEDKAIDFNKRREIAIRSYKKFHSRGRRNYL